MTVVNGLAIRTRIFLGESEVENMSGVKEAGIYYMREKEIEYAEYL